MHQVPQPVHGQGQCTQAFSVTQWLRPPLLSHRKPRHSPDFCFTTAENSYEFCYFNFPFRMVSKCDVFYNLLKRFKMYAVKKICGRLVYTLDIEQEMHLSSQLPNAVWRRERMSAGSPAIVVPVFSSVYGPFGKLSPSPGRTECECRSGCFKAWGTLWNHGEEYRTDGGTWRTRKGMMFSGLWVTGIRFCLFVLREHWKEAPF